MMVRMIVPVIPDGKVMDLSALTSTSAAPTHAARTVHVQITQAASSALVTLVMMVTDSSVPISMNAQLRVHAVPTPTVPIIQAHTNAHAGLVSRVMPLLVVLILTSVPILLVLQLEAHAATVSVHSLVLAILASQAMDLS